MHLLILGAGYSGKDIGKAFLSNGFRVTGTSRSQEKCDQLKGLGFEATIFDGELLTDELKCLLTSVTHLIQSISPSAIQGGNDPFLDLLPNDLRTSLPKLEWIAYLSTVGVYGDHGGAWVNEDTVPRPVSKRSIERLAAERAWQAAATSADLPLAILRLSGIYGPGRNALVNLMRGNAKRLIKQGQVFNRIRVEDIAGATAFLAERKARGIFNVTDDEPAPPQDVVTYAAELLSVEPPPEQSFETAQLTPMARSFYGENKRVSNAKIRSQGFEFKFPEYRKSLAQLVESQEIYG